MKFERIARQFRYSMCGALMMLSAWPSSALAQDDHSHSSAAGVQEQTAAQKKQAGALVQAVRQATAPFRFLDNPGPDYVLTFGCVSGSDFGAMGMHFVNGALLVPTYRDRVNDRRALRVLQSHLPKHEVIGIDCTELIWGLGSIHCLTQQQPRV